MMANMPHSDFMSLCAAALHAEAEADIRGVYKARVEVFLSDVCKSSVLCLIV